MKQYLHDLVDNIVHDKPEEAEKALSSFVTELTKQIIGTGEQLNEFDDDNYDDDPDVKKVERDPRQREFEKKNKDKIAAAKKEAGVGEEDEEVKVCKACGKKTCSCKK